MKYWDKAIVKDLSYDEAEKQAKENRLCYITRPEWEGFHFYDKLGDYCILLKNGDLVIFPKEIYDKDKNDWMVVSITDDALEILQEAGLI